MKIGYAGYLWRFAFYYIVVAAAVYGVLTLLEGFAPSWAAWFYGSGASSGLNVAAIMLPGIYLGQKWVRTEGAAMPRATGWLLALGGAVITVVLSGAFVAFLIAGDPQLQAVWADLQEEMSVFWIIAAAMFVFVVLMTRLAIWVSVRGEMRRAAR